MKKYFFKCDNCGKEFYRPRKQQGKMVFCSQDCKKEQDKVRSDTARTKHGAYNTGAYKSYRAMLQRCNNENNTRYDSYGGRGIRVCETWLESFDNFLSDMGQRPDGCSIDRIDVDGDYTPQNCRWATTREQSENKRDIVWADSGVKGVRFHKNRWNAYCNIDGKQIHIGCYLTKEDAIIARQRKVEQMKKRFEVML